MTRRVMAKILSDHRESATVTAMITPKKGTRSRSHTSLPFNDYRCSLKRVLFVVVVILAVVARKREEGGRKEGRGRGDKREARKAAAAVPQQQYPRVEWAP